MKFLDTYQDRPMTDEREKLETWLNELEGLWPPRQVELAREGVRLFIARAELPAEMREDDPELTSLHQPGPTTMFQVRVVTMAGRPW